ncbi:MAG TPA: aminomethyltransferase beta-barrel domain-containing protein [Nocardioidaceae bacterium]|nr:aminomethyltransferase beta-barrel domain-containing protein [Nocardioidaceae bacterium]
MRAEPDVRDRMPGSAPRPWRGTSGSRARGRRHIEVDLLDPAEGIAPGQAVVVYDGTRVVGSATIARTRRRQPA